MLIEFEVGNYRSFKAPVRLSMVAATPFKEFEAENVFRWQRLRLLRSAAIYGANASGKSNLFEALSFMRAFVLNSARGTQSVDPIAVTPFRFDTETESKPSHFQMIFGLGDVRYRYGFEADRQAVRFEWLFATEPRHRETALFLREGQSIQVKTAFAEGRGKEPSTRENALFLSTVDQANGPVAKQVLRFFDGLLILPRRTALGDADCARLTAAMLGDERLDSVLELLRRADLDIEDLRVRKVAGDDWGDPVPGGGRRRSTLGGELPADLRISVVHPQYADGARVGSVALDLATEESEGTRRFFCLAGPLVEALRQGRVLMIDEFDAEFHPLLTRAIVGLFHSPKIAEGKAQLIFVTHDTNLLRYGDLRRDQIWFMEKTRKGATDLYSLAELKLPKGTKVRKDAAFAKDYFRGRYGAIPYFGDFSALFRDEGEHGETSEGH